VTAAEAAMIGFLSGGARSSFFAVRAVLLLSQAEIDQNRPLFARATLVGHCTTEVRAAAAAHRHLMATLRFGPPSSIASEARVPGDKSISHRALLFSACARGTTTIEGINRGDDVNTTIRALRALGIEVDEDTSFVRVAGGEFTGDAGTIECANSGTTMRLLMGALAGRTACTLDGDASLRRRPMERVAEPLRMMGAAIETAAGGVPPVILRRGGDLRAIDYALPVASAQLKSAILLAALRADGITTVRSRRAARDHTERMLAAMGAALRTERNATSIEAGPLRALERIVVPGDPSAAIFFLVAAAMMPGAAVDITGVCVNPTRTAAFDVMRSMGAGIEIQATGVEHGEPVATIAIEGGSKLRGFAITPSMVSGLIDEIPALCALAALAGGESVVREASELRVKESDRIASTVRLLRAFGAEAREVADGIIVRGGSPLREPPVIDTHGDHRIGMTAAALAAAVGVPVEIRDAACISTSFPDFADRWSDAFGTSVSIL
jgi:3-phosphoshikimate 1-carboxyvinyltransferase